MRRKTWIFAVACLLAAAGAWLFWRQGGSKPAGGGVGATAVTGVRAGVTTAPKGKGAAAAAASKLPTLNTNQLAFRLSNTTNSIRQLETMPHVILLANAFIDTDQPLDLNIPPQLKATGDPGAYIVQARGPTDARFRAALQAAGGQIVSYIPNNAYLVNISASGASGLAGNSLVQAVLPYEPYYKIQSSLLGLAVNEQPLPPGTALSLGVFAADSAGAEAAVEQLGAKIIGRDRSPFGPVLRVLAPADWLGLVRSPMVQFAEPAHTRTFANDLSRVTVGVSVDTISSNNYLNLYGSNVLVAVNDSGVDTNQIELAPRVTALTPNDGVDTDGHGTHVAGIIASSGAHSLTPTDVGAFAEGSLSNANFRGKAPLADIFSLNAGDYSDYQLQTNAAVVGALISNNSWDYGNGDATYDLAAASYDAATRDAEPFTTGSQPVLFVFAAGNSGGGDNTGQEGSGDTILSPGTAKNVITVGALEQLRNITNWVTAADGTSNQIWMPETDSSSEVAAFSSRGNVGIGTEGSFGRFKPDLVSPGTFVVSTRSGQWDTNAYYTATNDVGASYPDQYVTTNFLDYFPPVSVPAGTVAISIVISSNQLSNPFPTNMLIYCQQSGYPDPINAPGSIDIITSNNLVSIPPGGGQCTIANLQGNGFDFAVGDPISAPVNFDLTVHVWVTNALGNEEMVLEGMNDQLAPYYRYESGTSMAAADVSGVLALIQDYFTNTLALTPSPALLKAVLINGTRTIPGYTLAVTNGVNFQGWGLDNIQDCVPVGGLTDQFNTPGSSFFVDQSPTNALATGDSHTYLVTLSTNNPNAANYPLRATLVWTDPPGDPAAAIKLVNNLDLIITNLDTGSVYIGNDISQAIRYNLPWNTNSPPNLDTINNVENILLPPGLSEHYSVTVIGRDVNVNAVTAQTNNAAGQFAPNVVQDFALVVSLGEGEVTNAFSVTEGGFASNPTGDQDFTVVTTTNAPLFNQLAGASSPLLGTNSVPLGTNTIWGPNGLVTIGMTNQWHFYLVTNTGPQADYTNAAFITFDSTTLSVPRMGVFADSVANATRPEADIDVYVSQDPSITNLNPVAISNALEGTSLFGVGDGGASVSQGGTEFVFFTNSAPGQVYYVGVYSEDQMAAEYAFLPVFTDIPFSGLDQNGNQIVNGLLLPVNIPYGSNAHPGVTNVFALATIPMTVEQVTVTNLDEHQNFGDLVGALKFGEQAVVLNNHDGFGNTYGQLPVVYNDSPDRPAGTTNSDGPGSLVNFRTQSAIGPWILSVLDDSAGGFTGQVSRLTLVIQPHRDLKYPGIIVSVPPGGWFIDYVDVPAGYTNLTFFGTNVENSPVVPPIQMYEKFGNDPTLTSYDQEATLTNGTYPPGEGNSISVGPPLPLGEYFVGLYNPNTTTAQNVFLSATLGISASVSDIYNYTSGSGQVLPDDAVSGSVVVVPNTTTQLVASVNVGFVMDTPRISDYTFTLVSPTGQRILLMENRGGDDTNGAGSTIIYTNVLNTTATGGAEAETNYLAVDPNNPATIPIIYNFYTIPDQMTVYDSTNPVDLSPTGPYCILNTGLINNPPGGGGPQGTLNETTNTLAYLPGTTAITIIMNQFGNPDASGGDAWWYTAGAAITNYQYLEFTDNTNLASVPIKFAQPPYYFTNATSVATNFGFEQSTNGNYFGPTNIYDQFGGWSVPTNLVTISTIESNAMFVTVTNQVLLTNNLVSVVSDPSTALGGDIGGSNYLALGNGTITRTINTVPGHLYNVTFWYRGPGIEGWWRGEGNALDSSDPENLANNGALIGRFNFPAGEVDQAYAFEDPGNQFQFAATNTYIQVPASPSLNVGAGGGFTIEGWINPTNLSRPQPLVEWLARVPTNTAVTNVVIVQGPVLDPATSHFYYLLAATNWTTSELWAEELGGHLVTVDTANEENWVYDTFTDYGALNRDLWTGLAYTNATGTYGWADGSTNLTYTNWAPGQPLNCSGSDYYVAITGPTNSYPGLWQLEDNLGRTCGNPPTNPIFGVVEVDAIPTNGVQFWISGTNWTPGETNVLAGCLYANIVDTNYVSHEIFSAPGLLATNVYQHVALTFDTNSGIAALYLNGTNVARTNLYTGGVSFMPKTDGDLLLGWDMSLYTNNYFGGEMDEMSLYSRALSLAEISAIYHVSADTTNRTIGKFDPSITPAAGLAEALVTFGSSSNILYGVDNQWLLNSFTFNATGTSMPLTISGIEPGILLDTFGVTEALETNLYYLPEQALSTLNGTPADGDWTLQVWDNRTGAFVPNVDQLVNWQLSLTLASNAVISASLPPQTPVTTTVEPGQVVYYAVPVPVWALEATNILVSSSEPVDLQYFSPANPPGTATAPDATLLTGQSGVGFPILAVNPVLPQLQLFTNQTYYLGVQNNNAHAAEVTLQVDYDILGLTNGAPFSDILTNGYSAVRYFSYDVSSNAYEATFQLLQLTGNADLVIRKGAPLPDLASSAAGSFNPANADENIYLLTNSTPAALSPGRWYLGVLNRDGSRIHYTVLAKELDITNSITNFTVIDLTNAVPFNWTAGPGAALTNFFRFHATNSIVGGTNVNISGLRFELYNQSGNGDLTVQTNTPPLAPPFFQTSQNNGNDPELIFVFTNNVLTNLAADWYLGVPNRTATNINFTIIAETLTNQYFPAFPEAQGAGAGAVGAGHAGVISTVYHVTTTADSGPSSLRAAVGAANRTVVFDTGGTITLLSPLVITNSNLTIAGQTSPGGITVAGNMTTVTNAHDVIVRDVRFRRGAADDSFQFVNASNVIADHISAEWTSDNNLSVLNSTNVTVQWSILADSLYYSTNTPTGSLLRGGNGTLSFHHNLYADNYSGSPRLGDNLTLDFENNVIYNWGLRPGLTGSNDLDYSPAGYTNLLNYVGNYLIAGPDTAIFSANNYNITNIAFFGTATNTMAGTWIFQTNNFIDSDNNGVLNGANTGWGMFTNDYTPFGVQFPTPPVSVDEAYMAYERVMDFAGVNLGLRDLVDTNIVAGVRSQTGRLIADPPYYGMIAWWKAEGNAVDSIGANNGTLVGGLGFAPGEVGQAFNFTKTNQYVYVPAGPRLNVGADSGFTVEEWIKPTDVVAQRPLFGWGTNTVPNTNVLAGPLLNPGNGHFYYLLQADSWSNSEATALEMGGNLATIRNLSELLWVSNSFETFGGTPRNLWIGLYDPTKDKPSGVHANDFVWVDGEASPYRAWGGGQPDNCTGGEFWVELFSLVYGSGNAGLMNDVDNVASICNGTGNQVVNGIVELTASPGVHLWTSVTWPGGGGPGCLYANIIDATNGSHIISSVPGLVQSNVYQHVALTYSTNSGIANLYLNGANVASANLGVFVPETTGNVFLGENINTLVTNTYSGGMDEVSLYKRALSQAEIQSIYNAGSAGKFPSPGGAYPYLDTDQDGLPDFWEDTFTPNLLYVPSNNNDRNGDGYTDLEEYNNWTAVPHALTVTNTAVGVDLYQMFGESGHLAFSVTNGVHGLVYLTNVLGSFTNTSPVWSNTIAVFTPTNNAATNYYGYASFDVYATNLDTAAYFGPVTVSVIVSTVPVAINSNMPPVITPLVSGVPSDPTNYGGSDFYSINITTNDVGALFEIESNTGPMAIVVNDSLPLPSLSSYDYYTNTPDQNGNEEIAVLTNSMPVPLAPGTWYMAAVNESGSNVVYTAKITLLQNILPPEFYFPTNTTVTNILATAPTAISCVATDLDTPPLPLTFAVVSGPPGLTISNAVILWTPTPAQGGTTNFVAVSVSNGAFSVTNTFQINVLVSNLPPLLPQIPNQIVLVPGGELLVTNTATNPNVPDYPLTYTLSTTVTGANQPNIDTNGIITWTPTAAQAGSNYLFTTVVTDTNPPAVNATSLSATNYFYVTVLSPVSPGQPLTNVIAPNGINWFAVVVPTNAVAATNTLLFATLPINLWFSTNVPPSITNAADTVLLRNATGGVSVLNTNLATAPTNLVPGTIYFLGVQNTNSVAVTNAIRVDFALVNPVLSLPYIPDQYITVGDTLVVANTATDVHPGAVLNYVLSGAPAGAVISTNGIITWLANISPVPTNVLFTTIVTDVGAGLSATNSFHVFVLPALSPGQPVTNTVPPGGIFWLAVNVPPNADWATNTLLFATAPVNFWYSTNVPPSITSAADAELLTNSTAGSHVIGLVTAPLLVPGSRYYLGVQNTNAFAVTNAVEVNFHLLSFEIFSIVKTNNAVGTNGFLITWFAPAGFQFHLQWTPALLPANWNNFYGVISFTSFMTATNSEFQYFDDGSQTGGFGPMRFYRLLLLNSPTNTPPFFLTTPTVFNADADVPFAYTNAAKDWDIPAQTLVYSITNSLGATNLAIDPFTGVITWTPTPEQAGLTNLITTTVTDNGVPPKSAVNSFVVNVNPVPNFSSITVGTNGVTFLWIAPTNDSFQIQWTTNLAPANWQVIPIIITSPTINFSFVDTNLPLLMMKFYQLILLP